MNTTQDAAHGLGWIDNTTLQQVKVAYTFYGDATLDGTVDGNDLAKVLANYNQSLPPGIGITASGVQAIQTAAGVPEPSTLVLLAAGLAGLLCYAWRKRR